jgi:hypothetical protein
MHREMLLMSSDELLRTAVKAPHIERYGIRCQQKRAAPDERTGWLGFVRNLSGRSVG